MKTAWKGTRQELKEQSVRIRETQRTIQSIDDILYPEKKSPVWSSIKIELNVLLYRLLFFVFTIIFAAVIYPIAFYILFKILL